MEEEWTESTLYSITSVTIIKFSVYINSERKRYSSLMNTGVLQQCLFSKLLMTLQNNRQKILSGDEVEIVKFSAWIRWEIFRRWDGEN